MGFKQKLSRATGITDYKLPSSYQMVGHVLLLKLPKIRSLKQKQKIGRSIMTLLPNVKTVCEIKEVKGEFREPVVVKLAGNGTATIHKENDIFYKLDTEKIMFSKGNLNERKRLIGQVKENENIVDMFAGIGYFSLGLAKFTKAREILAIEKNPHAYRFLTENIQMNKVSRINAIQGDCTMAAMSFKDYADRIVMGYFPGTEKFLPYALFMARNGCVVHYHNIYRINDVWGKPLEEIARACGKRKIKYEILAKKKVKSYAPAVIHAVVDFKVTK